MLIEKANCCHLRGGVEPGVGMRTSGRCCLSQDPGLGWAACDSAADHGSRG